MTEKLLLTPEGLEKLKAELEYLRTVRRPEVLQRLQKAKELADTVDNAEYEDAKHEQAFVEGRILTLERMIKDAQVISAEEAPAKYVRPGSRVIILGPDGEKEQYIIVGKAEANPGEGKISNESPLGQALLGRYVGEEVEVQAPMGTYKVKILAVDKTE